ncbi:hereditary hemochromatosis protein homolog isoform X1 [Engraulis encrasicolus]|uniref:hereditary hemochromatosis protein homolog isoform X1 n=1 Tax=Engraulis encrasicolus TaxID=184585 RepID=UPI002FD4368C
MWTVQYYVLHHLAGMCLQPFVMSCHHLPPLHVIYHPSLPLCPGSHSLWLMTTLIKGDTPFPELSAIFLVDDIQIAYYGKNDNKLMYRGQSSTGAETDSSDKFIEEIVGGYIYDNMKDTAEYLKNHKNHTNNILVLQRASGCELLNDGQPGVLFGHDAFNGEIGDARRYDPQLKKLHTDRVWPAAVDINWQDIFPVIYEHVLHPACINMLQKHLVKEKNRIFKKVKPKVRIIPKRGPGSSVLLICLATGFYPRHINLTLLRDGQPVPDHQITGGELLPNGDETYQMRKSLEVNTEELQQHQYTCTVQHLSLDNKLDVMYHVNMVQIQLL